MNLTTASIDLEDDQARIRNIELNEFIVQGGKFYMNQLNMLQVQFLWLQCSYSLFYPLLFLAFIL